MRRMPVDRRSRHEVDLVTVASPQPLDRIGERLSPALGETGGATPWTSVGVLEHVRMHAPRHLRQVIDLDAVAMRHSTAMRSDDTVTS
jgi:hypothetical protein